MFRRLLGLLQVPAFMERQQPQSGPGGDRQPHSGISVPAASHGFPGTGGGQARPISQRSGQRSRVQFVCKRKVLSATRSNNAIHGQKDGLDRLKFHGSSRGSGWGRHTDGSPRWTPRLTIVSTESILVSMETIARRPSAPKLERHLGYWLRRVSNHVSGEFARKLQTRRVSVAEWVVLCHVRERPGITPGELAEALALTRGAVSKVIDKLEAKRWITGSTKPEDNRVRMFSLTRRGSRVLPELTELADRNDQTFFTVLEADERATLQRLLSKLVERHNIGAIPIR